jgi:hypothetical protein
MDGVDDAVPRTYRQRTRYFRKMAADAKSPALREQWLLLAEQYERLADQADGIDEGGADDIRRGSNLG